MEMSPDFSIVADGFAQIEKRDVRVGRVDIPDADFARMRAFKDFPFLIDDNSPLSGGARVRLGYGTRHTGTLWGADLYTGSKRMVVYPEGWPDVKWQNISGSVVKPCVVSELGFHDLDGFCGVGLTIVVKSHCKPFRAESRAEQVALETLREAVTEEEFRGYLRTGFLCVRGASGDIYQIPRGINGYGHVKVWRNGVMVEEVCSVIRDRSVPPTDRVLAFKAIIEADEQEFRSIGNVFNMAHLAA